MPPFVPLLMPRGPAPDPPRSGPIGVNRELVDRYRVGLRKRHPALKAVPWFLIAQVVLLAIRYFLLDTRTGKVTVTDLFGPPGRLADGPYTGDLDNADVASYLALE
jgi:hypothetical protein